MPEAPLQADGLVRHPRPYPTESLFGYVLRLAEENGYRRPFSVLALMGGNSYELNTQLRASGYFEVKYIVMRDGYHEHDIKQFIDRLLALNSNPMNTMLPRDCITLYQAMCRYHGTGVRSASIIRALLCGELRVLGNVDGTVRGLFVSRAEFEQFGKNERARQNGNVRTPSEVAKEISCSKRCIPGLVGRKLLDGGNTPTGLRISEASIAKFKKQYMSLVSIAREIGSSAYGLMGYCAAKHIPMVVVPYDGSRQAFVRIKDRNAVLSFGQCAKRAQILATLKQTKWVVSGPNGAALRLGLTGSTLQFRMRKLGIARPI